MKICWDNLEKIIYRPDREQWQEIKNKSHFYTYKESCKTCGNPFLFYIGTGNYCSLICSMKSEKRSEAVKGKNNPFYGKKHSKETKDKISELNKGKFYGENSPHWKGGISRKPYCEIWLDKEYKDSIKERDGYKCMNPYCSKENKILYLHHINYIKKECRPNNLITLCNSCNVKANYDREWHKSWYKAILFRRYNYE